MDAAMWEAAWAPYDEPTYRTALSALRPDDIVLDIGAGDLRLAKRAAQQVREVIAIEQRAELLSASVPRNVRVICGDARTLEFPSGVTAAVLLMRHCRHFTHYRSKLERAGCRRLITNARWGMNVEVIDLQVLRLTYDAAPAGWYACRCGAVGFKPGLNQVQEPVELESCPHCLRV
jgi:hypothetical protein